MSVHTHSSSVTLESVKQAFDKWRGTKPRANTPTPQYLWDMAKILLTDINPDVLRATLKITRVQMQKYLLSTSKNTSIPVRKSDFVALKPPVKEVHCDIVIQHVEGHEMHLCIGQTLLQQVISTFVTARP